MSKMSFRTYTKIFIGTSLLVNIIIFMFLLDYQETKMVIAGTISMAMLTINNIQFSTKYSNTRLYNINAKVALAKEPLFVWLFLAGIAMGLLSDVEQKVVISLFLAFSMVHLKYIVMHIQLKQKLKGTQSKK